MYALYWTSQVALVVKNLPANAGDVRDAGSIPESERFPGGGHGNPLQCSCLKNPVDRGAWWATIHRVAKSWIRLKWLGVRTHTHTHPLLCCSTFFSMHSCWRSFIMKGCWVLLNMFSVSVAMAILFLSFILLMWSVILTDLNMLNHPCSLGLSSTCLWWMFLLMCCWILIC